MLTRAKVKGLLIGGAIGDALGAPVETWGPKKIVEVHGGPIAKYVAPIGHKWFKPEEFLPGMTTDDTQLTVATMEGLIKGDELGDCTRDFDYYMDAIAEAHVAAMKHAIGGWGKSTTEAVQRLANGVHWRESGQTTERNRGTGNGVPMKNSPLALWQHTNTGNYLTDADDFLMNQKFVDFSAMTHWSRLSAEASVVHGNLIGYLIWATPETMVIKHLLDLIVEDVWEHKKEKDHNFWSDDHLEENEHTMRTRLEVLRRMWLDSSLKKESVEKITGEFGGGSCYVYDSVPFSYAMFLRNPNSLQSIIDTANAGGDNDTNAKLVGEMIGVLHGIDFFMTKENRWAVEGLHNSNSLFALANRFCENFKIED
jgi:ADP-ribosylglycohydrolase